MNEYVIEKNLPMPQRVGKMISNLSKTLRAMEPGDSIIVDQRGRNSAFAIAHNVGIKLASRRIDDTQIRLWRVA